MKVGNINSNVAKLIIITVLMCLLVSCGNNGKEEQKKDTKDNKKKEYIAEINKAALNFINLKNGLAESTTIIGEQADTATKQNFMKISFQKSGEGMQYTKEYYNENKDEPTSIVTIGEVAPFQLQPLKTPISADKAKEVKQVNIKKTDKNTKKYELKMKTNKKKIVQYGNEKYNLIRASYTYTMKDGILVETKKEEQRENVFEKAPTGWRSVCNNQYVCNDIKLVNYEFENGKKRKHN